MIPNVKSILSQYTLKQLLVRIAEEYVWWMIRSWPGLEGVVLRYLFLKCTAKKLAGFCWISPGCTLVNSYGLSIGKNFAVNRNVIIDGIGGIEIGDGTGIGPNCVLLSQEHSMLSQDMRGYTKRPIKIGAHVWIGSNCFIKAGVNIGDDAVIAACSNVIADVSEQGQVIGSPARPYFQVMREFLSTRT